MKLNVLFGLVRNARKDLKKLERKKGGKIVAEIIRNASRMKSDRNYGACYPWNDEQGGDWGRA